MVFIALCSYGSFSLSNVEVIPKASFVVVALDVAGVETSMLMIKSDTRVVDNLFLETFNFSPFCKYYIHIVFLQVMYVNVLRMIKLYILGEDAVRGGESYFVLAYYLVDDIQFIEYYTVIKCG